MALYGIVPVIMLEIVTQFFTKTKDAWAAMLLDLQNAKKTIDLEQYIFTPDVIGRQFIQILEQKIREGVKVRLLVDAVGSWGFYRSTLPIHLKKLGAEVKFFNPISAWRIPNFTDNFFRDHRKILVIDNEIGHLGGVGIQDSMANWRDTHMRIVGPLVPDITTSFEASWLNIGKIRLRRSRLVQPFVKKYNIITNSPWRRKRYMYYSYVWNIRNAQKYIYLTTPYFVPDLRLFRVLRLAAKRGVDVRILMPDIADHLFVDRARQSYFTSALKSGIKLYKYHGTMMHAKTAVIDGEWATAGSYNLDNLSAYFNDEVNIDSSDKKFIDAIHDQFLEDLRSCKEVKYEEWISRPWRQKFLEFLTWPFHGIM